MFTQLFPSWCGRFDGARPSLAGLNNDHVITALESGLMTESEVAALLYLIRSPDVSLIAVDKVLEFIVILGTFPQSPLLAVPLLDQHHHQVPGRYG